MFDAKLSGGWCS